MVVHKQVNGSEWLIQVEGQIDTNTSPELEKEIAEHEGVTKIVLDFEEVEYISSSGLRVILKFKKEVEDTSVINCRPEVYDIFTMTGFTKMMQIEKAMRHISIDHCEKIGEGFFGVIYRIDPETIVKVYKVPDALEMIRHEIEIAQKAFVMGVPTAIAYDIVRVGDGYGAVFELLNAKPIVDLIDDEEELDNFARKSAAILKEMHQKELEPGELPSRKQVIVQSLKECENYLSKETFQQLLTLLETIPEKNTMLHCDFHVKNIMLQNDDLLLIDMDTLSCGHPIFEFGAMYATYEAFSCVDKLNTDKFLNMPLSVTEALFEKTFRYYYDDKSEEELQEIMQRIAMISYLEVLYIRTKFADLATGTAKEEVDFCVQYLTEKAKELTTLAY